MSNKFVQRCVSALTFLAILVLVAVVVYVWVTFSPSAIKTKQQHYKEAVNGSEVAADGDGQQTKQLDQEFHDHQHHQRPDTELVKPIKISPPELTEHDVIYDKLHNYHGKPTLRHHSGHFRHKTAEIWDPHPSYVINAFGEKLTLDLENDSKFVPGNLHITMHIHDNYTQRVRHDPKMAKCFYSGKIRGDSASAVAVSLCNGMTGYIRTNHDSYHIEPVKSTNNTLHSFVHKLHRLPPNTPINSTNGAETPAADCETNDTTHTIIEDDFPTSEVVQKNPQHTINKRSVPFDDLDTEVENHTTSVWMDELTRTTRDTDWVRSYGKRSNEYYIKVLVVVDRTMVEYHRTDEDLQHYILTLMSHVALLYKDATIGNAISVSVVHINILHHGDFSNSNSQDMLRQFCSWQEKNTVTKQHDAALLLTRDTICKNSSANMCNTLGVAEVASICSAASACAIVRDKGLSTSYTIAHELGHLLSMPHDDDKKCNEYNTGYKQNNIMSKMMQNDTKPWMWSACSKHFVTEFLDSNRAKCLLTPPSQDFLPLNYDIMRLPGETFQVDRQCELEFGSGAKLCSFMPHCGSLWCAEQGEENGCKTQFLPWAEGTSCGSRRWCHHGKCIPLDRELFTPINGGWGEWQPWGACSRTCGGGIRLSKRACDSPKPENGGAYCTGRSVRYASCNIEECDTSSPDFRAVQCATFNGITKSLPNLTANVEWVPKYGLDQPEDFCRLYCRPKNSNAYYMLKEKVTDGTKCGLTSFDICVNGICRPGGCDNKLESKMMLDDCGICGGDNSRCEEIAGTYNISVLGYNRVTRIPKGSSNLDIRQKAFNRSNNDDNYLALVDGETGEYILNGNYMAVTHETDVVFGSLIIKYSGSYTRIESITTPKNHKLTKDLVLEVLSVGNVTPPDISYRYVISQDSAPKYGWRLYRKQWSKCNSICSGTRFLRPVCVELATNVQVEDRFCEHLDRNSVMQKEDCNTHCQLTWNIESKGVCSAHCGKGIRNVYYNCMRVHIKKPSYSEIVDEKHCSILPKPLSLETCVTVCNSTRWDYSSWSECSRTCGGGTQRRTAECVDNNTVIDAGHCNGNEKITEQICNTNKCPAWVVGEQSGCSTPCGGGYRNITLYCVVDGRIFNSMACDQSQRPAETAACNEQPCVAWSPAPWSPCSTTCGNGIESRDHICESLEDKMVVNAEYCKELPRPAMETRACLRESCDELALYKKKFGSGNDISDNSIGSYENPSRYQWVPADWTACSKTCDGGLRYQLYTCRNEFGEENDLACNANLKPRMTKPCNSNVVCARWKTGDWSPNCDGNCEKRRQVRCVDHTNSFVEDFNCDATQRPVNSTKCKLSDCRHVANTISKNYFDEEKHHDKRYRWKVGRWRQCSNSCGNGLRRRHIDCEDSLNDIIVVDSLCNNLPKPKTTKHCERFNCKYAWIESQWSPCSKTCGSGLKTRNVTCHRVHSGGVVDPVPLPEITANTNKILHNNYCNLYAKPNTTAKCMLSHCTDLYVWQRGDWKPCSTSCGKKGRQMRQVYCVDVKTKQRIPRFYCPRNLKPPRKRKCNQWRCLNKSCKEIKQRLGTRENKDYLISIRNRPAQVYCYKMDTPEPEEFISLQSDGMNYAESYDRRLEDTNSCPDNGQRTDNCQCISLPPERSGFTKFWKVRLNITTMRIIGDDYTFSRQMKGSQKAFGTAEDCYSAVEGCAQGRFSLDLTGTSFKLTSDVRWIKIGTSSSMEIRRSDTTVSGKCGGYCGKCFPDPAIGLQVEIT